MRATFRSVGFFVVLLLAGVSFALAQDKAAPKSEPKQPATNHFNEPLNGAGELPKGEDGQPLNLNFEDGTLRDWTATGQAFDQQPVKGEIDKNRPFGEGKKADHTGQYWIGTFERLLDKPKGTLTSKAFTVTQPWPPIRL
jgi:hypothetical protein